MKQAIFNYLVNFEYPDDFVELTAEENKKYFSGDLLRLSFQNKEKHILLSISKSKDSFINYTIATSTVISSSVINLKKNLKDFEALGSYESTIFKKEAITECFSYTAKDENVKQYGELSVFKYKKAFYVIYCLSRLADKDANKELFTKFKESFK